MKAYVNELLLVQNYDSKIRNMEKEIRDIPARQEAEKLRLKEHKKLLEDAENALEAKKKLIKDVSDKCDSIRNKISKLRQQQLEIKTNKEFKAINTEIKGFENEISKLDDKAIILMEESESADANVADKKNMLEKEEVILNDELRKLDERVKLIKVELEQVQQERAAASNNVDSKIMAIYNGISERKSNAFVHIEEGICGGCHMKLPAYVINDAKKTGMMVVSCNFCGRMLY